MLTSQDPKGPEKQGEEGLDFLLQISVENIPTFYITTSLLTPWYGEGLRFRN